jgi:hypothetical protein
MLLAMIAAVAALPAQSPTAAARNNDLACLVVLGASVGAAPAAQRPTLIAGTRYYVGRIEGREPAFDLTRGVVAIVPRDAAQGAAFIQRHAPRCQRELQRNEARMKAMSDALQARPRAGAK